MPHTHHAAFAQKRARRIPRTSKILGNQLKNAILLNIRVVIKITVLITSSIRAGSEIAKQKKLVKKRAKKPCAMKK